MLKLFKDSFKPIYYYLVSDQYREYIHLHHKFSNAKRYEILQARFRNHQILINDSVSFLNQYDEIFFKEVLAFQTDSGCPVILDCGANIGMSVLYFKKLFPNARIKAFEADTSITKLMQQNIQSNKLQNVEVINMAVWINNDEIKFGTDGAQGGSVFLKSNVKTVQAIRLKNELEKEKRIDMLKLDIEGAETEVLRDCDGSLCHVKNIALAYHSLVGKKQALDEILSILSKNRFRYYIQNSDKKAPFLNKDTGSQGMDLLIDIFASKE